jgi:glutathione S-transferase
VRRLITISISHYCEKARWALERAGLDYAEERHVQIVHRVFARRAGGGRTVPVLVAPEGVFSESEEILRYADERLPEDERLFPADPELRREVDELSRRLDDRLGPAGRRLIYAHMLEQPRIARAGSSDGVPAWERRAMSALWPLVARLAKRDLGIRPDTPPEDERVVRDEFDAIAARLADGRPYLCGARFTAADLTFAALAAAVLLPPRYGVALPQPDVLPPHTADLVRSFREHPAGSYALRLFETHR